MRTRRSLPSGKVRQTELARRMGLAKNEFPLRSVQRAPLAHTALQGTAYAVPEFGMPAHQFSSIPTLRRSGACSAKGLFGLRYTAAADRMA